MHLKMLSASVVCCIYLLTLLINVSVEANSEDHLIWVYTVWPRGFLNISTNDKSRRLSLWLVLLGLIDFFYVWLNWSRQLGQVNSILGLSSQVLLKNFELLNEQSLWTNVTEDVTGDWKLLMEFFLIGQIGENNTWLWWTEHKAWPTIITWAKGNSGGCKISGKGVHIGVGVRFADFITFFLDIPWEFNNLVSLRPNYLIFIGYFKTGGGKGGVCSNPLSPLWIRHCGNHNSLHGT